MSWKFFNIQTIFVANCFLTEFPKLIKNLWIVIKFNTSEHDFFIKLAFTYIFSQVTPSVQRDTGTSCCFNAVNIVLIVLNSQNDGNVIKLWKSYCSCYSGGRLGSSKENNISCFRFVYEFLLTDVVQLPRWLDAVSGSLELMSVRFQNLRLDSSFPNKKIFCREAFKSEFLVITFHSNVKTEFFGLWCIQFMLEELKVENSIGCSLINIALKVEFISRQFYCEIAPGSGDPSYNLHLQGPSLILECFKVMILMILL